MPKLLQGGKKRRRASKWLAAIAIVVAPLALAGAAWLTLHGKHKHQGPGLGVLKRGKGGRLETLLNGMLLVSGNDAPIALAVHVAGTERRFVRLMNRRARLWGLRCTHYVDSHGLGTGDRSCPHDLG